MHDVTPEEVAAISARTVTVQLTVEQWSHTAAALNGLARTGRDTENHYGPIAARIDAQVRAALDVTTTSVPREIPDAQVEAAARALFATEEPDRNDWRWDRPEPGAAEPFGWHEYWLSAARTALSAARASSGLDTDRG